MVLLSVSAWVGLPALLLLFILCFLAVHILILARRGLYSDEDEDKTAEEQPQEKKAEQPPPEPIYYIVEKKRKPKATYSPPKQIDFKEK